MKRIFILLALAISSVGCTLTYPSNTEVTAHELQVYGSNQFGKTVAMPSGVIGAMIDFDAYLKKSDEEKIQDENFYGNVTFMGDNKYDVYHRSAWLNYTVDTGGKSILDKDAVWTIAYIGYYEFYGEVSIGVSLDINIDDPSTIRMVADSTWNFTSKGTECTLTNTKKDQLDCWSVVGISTENGDNGLKSISATGEDGVNVWRIKETNEYGYSYTNLSYSGTFTTEIYQEDNQIDFCTFAFKPGFNSSITTSRD